jgi:ligand-binding sensor domain-containing protein
MTNSNVAEPISVLKADGSWKSFRVNNLISGYGALGDILVSSAGHKWVIIPRGNGLFAMDDNMTIDDISDDIYEKVSVVDKYGKVITNDVYSFAEDHNGNLWLGTNQGVLVMYSPYRLFTDGIIYAQEILIPRNDGSGYADPLLGTQIVTSIEVDGANRKWLGTAGGGVYLVSEDGLEELVQFNETNSPLLSNAIRDICVDGVSGEVFFGTDKGIISYKGDALQGSTAYNKVVVYPNPVRESYEGPVAIKGLVERTTVKITDMSGNLVFETESFGGQAIWDGKNLRGERVATGVYMIYLSNRDGTLAHVTKVLFIH